MPLTPNFSASQTIGSPITLSLEDVSTGTDVGITSRRVYIQKADGTYLTLEGATTDYEVWDISDTTIDLDLLDQDYALNIMVQWMTGTTPTYSKTILFEFQAYALVYRIKLLKAIASNPSLINSPNFFNVLSNLTVFIDGGSESVSLAGDINLAQLCNEKAKYYILNPKLAY